MDQKKYKKKLYELWENFWLSEGEQAEALGIELVSLFESQENLDAEDHYLWGLSIYSLNQNDVLERSHPFFKKALKKDDGYYLARLYSAHCFHDKGEYGDALSEYLKVDQELLKEEMPIWRWVKLLEQIGFCYVKLKKTEKAKEYFEQVVFAFEGTEKDELVPIQEAYECLESVDPMVVKLKEAESEYFS